MYRKLTKSWTKHLDFILLDLLCLQIAFVIAYMIRHGVVSPYTSAVYRNMGLFLLLTDIILVVLAEVFKNVLKRGYYKEFTATIKHAIWIELLSVLYLFTIQSGEEYSRIVLYLTGILYIIIDYLVRISWKHILTGRMEKNGNIPLLIIANEQIADSVVENIRNKNYRFYKIAGLIIVDRDMTGQVIKDVPVVADVDKATDYICREWIEEVFVIVQPGVQFPGEMVSKLIEAGLTVHVNISEVFGESKSKRIVEKIANYTVVTTGISYATTKQMFVKRCLDIIGGLIGCLLTGAIAVIISPIIYLKSPGPIIFSQIRVGKNGKRFKMYKFRSMYPDAEERKKEYMQENRVKDGRMFKLSFDPRVIGNEILPSGEKKYGIGHFIRVTSIDEFPQFYNVLKGDMSLVGTRPPTLDEWGNYKLHHRARLAIKPGITGLWQVSGRSNITDFEEVVKLDTRYITEWSMGLDFRILFQTILVILRPNGSM